MERHWHQVRGLGGREARVVHSRPHCAHPNDFIPKRYLDVLNEAAGGQRRSTATMGAFELLTVPAAAELLAVPAVPSQA